MGSRRGAALVVTTVTVASVFGCADRADELGSSTNALVAGRQLSESEVAGVVRAAGFPESMVGTMVCTAKYESSFYDRATNQNTNGSSDYGLFQINSIHIGGTAGCPSSAEPLFDVTTNAACALAIYNMQGINAWYGYKKHKAECDAYPAPQSSGAPSQPQPGAPEPGVVPGPGTPTVPEVPEGPRPNVEAFVDPSTPGSCYSPYLRISTIQYACVRAAGTGTWVQCSGGSWYTGVDIARQVGPFGPCAVLVTP